MNTKRLNIKDITAIKSNFASALYAIKNAKTKRKNIFTSNWGIIMLAFILNNFANMGQKNSERTKKAKFLRFV